MSFADREQVRDKVEWEGGITEALNYGLTVDDMPDGDAELREAWAKLIDAYAGLEPLEQAVYALLNEENSNG